ncbi:MAG: hypothetical protein FWF31_11385, partial [Desulfobulbus sp.]|nr:hypothetical protein [Desulfobulbus sp.]
SDGKAYIKVQVNPDLTLSTWNNSLSDIEDKTMIVQGTNLFNSLSSMTKGQKIKFSGSFIKDQQDYYKERSMTIDGSMTDPDYVFRFSEVTKLP